MPRILKLPTILIPAMLLVAHAATAHGAELGELRVHSWLGRQLKASVPLTGDDARASEGRCFKAALLNLNREVLSPLKVVMQQSSTGPVLLLAGGGAIDEPAALVAVESVCASVAGREYTVLLDLGPASPPVDMTTAAAKEAEADSATTAAGERAGHAETKTQGRQTQRAGLMQADDSSIGEHAITIAGLKLAPVLASARDAAPAAFGASAPRRAGLLDDPVRAASASDPLLKLTRQLAATTTGKDTSPGTGTVVAGALLLACLLGAAGWIAMRVRAMRASARPWIPDDVLHDATVESQPVSARRA